MSDLTPTPPSASDILLTNAIEFLNAGIRILFRDAGESSQAKVGVVTLQTAAELFAKHRLVRTNGLSAILVGGLPTGDLAIAALSGRLKTIGHRDSLKLIRREEGMTEQDRTALETVQNLRNALVHFGARLDVETVRMQCAWMLVRVLAMFAAADERDVGEFQNYRRFLDQDTFSALIAYRAYHDEAVDAAIENLESEDVLKCWECGFNALSVRATDALFCWCCGLTVDGSAVGHVDCQFCHQRLGVMYDPHNLTAGCLRGRCTACDRFVWIRFCDICLGETMVQEAEGPQPCLTCSNLGIDEPG